jgi:hypothetical protein
MRDRDSRPAAKPKARVKKRWVIVVVSSGEDGHEGVIYGPCDDRRKAQRRAKTLGGAIALLHDPDAGDG